ncbi:MAG: hypothetical protein Q8P62_01760 [Candidatus Peregrinibacteria bacterium]|nr:hypothetical protein [Candidatus Peregrinibacteria bacterium]
MGKEGLKIRQNGEILLSLKQGIVYFGDFVDNAEKDAGKLSKKDIATRLLEVGHFTSNFFKDHPGKWPEEDVKSMYDLIKKAGVLGSNYDLKEATVYVRLALTELSKHAKTLTDKSFEAKLSHEKDHFEFAYLIDFDWLGEAGLKKMYTIAKMISELGKTVTKNDPGTLKNFDYVFSNLDALLDEYADQILDGSEAKKVASAKEKIKGHLAIKFYTSLVSNPAITSAEKIKVLDFVEANSVQVPGLFGEKRTLLAEGTAAKLEGKKRKKFKGPRTASERVSEREHKSLSVASFNSEDVVLFDYKEGAEVQLEMPEAMKVQLNSIALIGDLAETLLKAGKIDSKVSNRVIAELNYLQDDLVGYYTNEDYDGKTPFNLEAELAPLMSGGRLKDFVNAVKKIALSPARTSGMLYRTELLKLLSGKSLNDMSEVKMAGFAIAWIQRNVFDDHMSARGLMAKLLHKDVMAAREKLEPEVKEKLYKTAYNDARKSITSMLSNGDVRENFRENFKKRYLKDNHKMPANAQVDAAYGRFFSSLFESQHMSLYDNYLTLTAFSDKYMKAAPISGVDKKIYEEFCDSTDPNNDPYKLSDEGRALLSGVTKEVLIMAAAMIVTVGVGVAARLATAGIRGLSMIKNATMMARYAAEAAMFTGTVAVEAGAFYDVNAFLHGEATIAGTALVEGDWAKAGIMLALEMPMFALLGGAHYAAGFAKMGVSGEAKALMAAAKKYPEHAKSIKNILALAKSSPGKAILAMAEALEKGGLPKEIAQIFGRAIENVNIIGAQYRGVLGKISDPFAQKAIGVLVVDLNFDAAAIMLGSYLKEKIHPTDGSKPISEEERGAIEAVLLEYGKSYLMAAGFKGAFHGVGKLARKVPEFLPQGVRERLIGTYKNAKGEFIDREGLINMLKSKLEVGGFDEALAQMEKAKVLILTVEDVLLFTSELPEGKARKFLETCKRMMSQSERQLVVDTVSNLDIAPRDFARGKSEMPMDLFRKQSDFLGKLITAKVLAVVLRVFSPEAATPPAERPVAAAFESPTAKSIAERPNASKDSRTVVMNPEAKTAGEALKDLSDVDVATTSQDSIFANMEKAGIKPEEISALKTAYASLPDLVKQYCRIFGTTNTEGQLVASVAVDQQGLAREVGFDAATGKVDPEKGKKFAKAIGAKPEILMAGVGGELGWEDWLLGAWLFSSIYPIFIRQFKKGMTESAWHKNPTLSKGALKLFFGPVFILWDLIANKKESKKTLPATGESTPGVPAQDPKALEAAARRAEYDGLSSQFEHEFDSRFGSDPDIAAVNEAVSVAKKIAEIDGVLGKVSSLTTQLPRLEREKTDLASRGDMTSDVYKQNAAKIQKIQNDIAEALGARDLVTLNAERARLVAELARLTAAHGLKPNASIPDVKERMFHVFGMLKDVFAKLNFKNKELANQHFSSILNMLYLGGKLDGFNRSFVHGSGPILGIINDLTANAFRFMGLRDVPLERAIKGLGLESVDNPDVVIAKIKEILRYLNYPNDAIVNIDAIAETASGNVKVQGAAKKKWMNVLKIALLLGALGGAGYGAYRYMRSPTPEEVKAEEEEKAREEAEETQKVENGKSAGEKAGEQNALGQGRGRADKFKKIREKADAEAKAKEKAEAKKKADAEEKPKAGEDGTKKTAPTFDGPVDAPPSAGEGAPPSAGEGAPRVQGPTDLEGQRRALRKRMEEARKRR